MTSKVSRQSCRQAGPTLPSLRYTVVAAPRPMMAAAMETVVAAITATVVAMVVAAVAAESVAQADDGDGDGRCGGGGWRRR